MNIFRTKDVSLGKTEMHRHLKLWDLILLGIGAMVGTGIFTITEAHEILGEGFTLDTNKQPIAR